MNEAAGLPGDLPGARLAAARAAQGLTVAEVAAQLRLAPRQVEALEADDYAALPGPVFVRGFLRNYARLLKLDAASLMAGLEVKAVGREPVLDHDPSASIPFPSARSHRWVAYVVGVLIVVLAAAVYELWYAPSGTPVPADSAPAQSQPSGAAPTSPVQGMPTAPLPLPGGLTTEVASVEVGAKAEPNPPGTPAGSAQAGAGRDVRLHLRFAGESWVEVRDRAGNVLHRRTHAAGTEQSFSGTLPLDVVVGNSPVVRMTYNGAPFDLGQHSTTGVARFSLE